MKAEALRQWRRQRQRRRLALAVALGVIFLGLGIATVLFWPHPASHTIRIAPHRSPSASTTGGGNPLNLPSPDLLKPIAPDEAIKENAEPLSESIIDSKGPIDFVLELNAGTVKRLRLRAGNRVENALMESLRKGQ